MELETTILKELCLDKIRYNVIYPRQRYNYGDKYGSYEINQNKINKRLIYGDDVFGKGDTDLFGRRGFIGNKTIGINRKFEEGWLEESFEYWLSYMENYNTKKGTKTDLIHFYQLYKCRPAFLLQRLE